MAPRGLKQWGRRMEELLVTDDDSTEVREAVAVLMRTKDLDAGTAHELLLDAAMVIGVSVEALARRVVADAGPQQRRAPAEKPRPVTVPVRQRIPSGS